MGVQRMTLRGSVPGNRHKVTDELNKIKNEQEEISFFFVKNDAQPTSELQLILVFVITGNFLPADE